MSSLRIALLAILTVCVFSAVDFLSTGFWIFPFPVYKTGLFVLVAVLLFSEKKLPETTGFLAIGWSFALMLSSRFFLETFLSSPEVEKLYQGMYISYVLICFLLLFSVWAILISLKAAKKSIRLPALIAALAFCCCLALEMYGFALVPLLLWSALLLAGSNGRSPDHAILLLVTFVYTTAWIMGAYASAEMQAAKIPATGTDFILFSM